MIGSDTYGKPTSRELCKRTHLGRFPTAREAAIAYNEAALRYFGDHARLNVIVGDPRESIPPLQKGTV